MILKNLFFIDNIFVTDSIFTSLYYDSDLENLRLHTYYMLNDIFITNRSLSRIVYSPSAAIVL